MELNEKPDFYLLLPNLISKNNSGTLIRSASAFNCNKIFILNKEKKEKKKIIKKLFGSQGTVKKMKFELFENIDALKEYLNNNKISICCVDKKYKNEKKDIEPIENIKFNGNILFILGNNNNIIDNELEKLCNLFTYIEENNKFGELNLSIIGSIAFHYFGIYNNYKQTELNQNFNNEKYVVNNYKNNNINNNENNI